MSDSPIFEQLYSEYQSNGKPYDAMLTGGLRRHLPVSAWKAAIPQESGYLKISENVEPETVEEKYGTFSGFVKHLAQTFVERYPNATDVETCAQRELDGSVTVSVMGKSGKDVLGGQSAQEALQALEDARQQYFAGPMLKTPSVVRRLQDKADVSYGESAMWDLKDEPIEHDLAKRQYELYRSLCAVTDIEPQSMDGYDYEE